MADEGINPEEHGRWLTPAQALSLLGVLEPPTAVREIIRKLWDGEIHAAAKSGVLRRGQEVFRSDYPRITAQSWGGVQMNLDTALWKTGTLDLVLSPNFQVPVDHWVFHGVRFDPEGILDLLAATASTPPATAENAPIAKDERKPLAVAERQRFARLYAEVFGELGTEARAHQAIAACYPDFKVARDPFLADFRAIRGSQAPGRKAKTGK